MDREISIMKYTPLAICDRCSFESICGSRIWDVEFITPCSSQSPDHGEYIKQNSNRKKKKERIEMANKWQKEIKRFLKEESDIMPDKIVCHKDGTLSVMRGYYYRHGLDAEKWAERVMNSLGEKARLVLFRDEYKTWPADSYFRVIIQE